MTITFKCPHCGSLCAFDDKHAGRIAKCLHCRNRFTIPSADDIKAEKIKEEQVKASMPKPGFYRAVFSNTWVAFGRKNSFDGFFHLTILIILKYVFGTCASSMVGDNVEDLGIFRIPIAFLMMVMLVLHIGTWGAIMKFYMKVITETALGGDEIEGPDRDEGFSFWHNHFKPFCVFMLTIFAAFVPLIIANMIYYHLGKEAPSIYSKSINIMQVLVVIGVFLIPVCLIAISVMRDLSGLRPDNLVKPVIKAFPGYLVVVGVFGLAFYLESKTGIKKISSVVDTLSLLYRMVAGIFIQIPIIWAMRSAGLFYRHYSCYFVY